MKKLSIYLVFIALIYSCKSEKSEPKTDKDSIKSETISTNSSTNATQQNSLLISSIRGTSLWTGTIGDKIPVKVSLTVDDVVIYGTVEYKNSGKPITLLGYKDEKNEVVLHEYYKSGNITGVYYGTIVDNSMIKGSWYTGKYDLENEEKEKEFVIKLDKMVSTSKDPVKVNVTGKYQFQYGGENGSGGTMEAGQMGDSITAYFSCVTHGPGFNIAETLVTEKLNNNYFISESKNEEGICKFEAFFMPGGAYVRHLEGGYECGFGHNATVTGIYYKVNNESPDFEKINKER